MRQKSTYIAWLFLMLSLVANAYFIWLLKVKPDYQPALLDPNYKLLSPYLAAVPVDSNQQSADLILHFNGLRDSIEKIAKPYVESGNQKYDVYIQNIPNGSWLGIN